VLSGLKDIIEQLATLMSDAAAVKMRNNLTDLVDRFDNIEERLVSRTKEISVSRNE